MPAHCSDAAKNIFPITAHISHYSLTEEAEIAPQSLQKKPRLLSVLPHPCPTSHSLSFHPLPYLSPMPPPATARPGNQTPETSCHSQSTTATVGLQCIPQAGLPFSSLTGSTFSFHTRSNVMSPYKITTPSSVLLEQHSGFSSVVDSAMFCFLICLPLSSQ